MTSFTETLYPIFLDHPVVVTDSRAVEPGSLFFSLKGDRFDGNQYAAVALRDGAAFAVVDDPAVALDGRYILVDDVLAELQALAMHHRALFQIPVIAITGTNGKTTTKEIIRQVLSQSFNCLATEGNLNNHIGVPLTLLRITRETGIAVIEMGANHPGEIDFLCRIARPGFGIITNIGKAHLEGFGGFQGVINTKTELYRHLAQHNGTVFLNTDDELLVSKAIGLRTVTYGTPPADLGIRSVSASPSLTLEVEFTNQQQISIHTELYGIYNAANLAAAACIGHYFGVPAQQIVEAIENFTPTNNRSQIVETGKNRLILDAYNANPSSMDAALKAFAAADYPSKTVILGDMLELGDEDDQEHRQILSILEGMEPLTVYLVGPRFTRINTKREYQCFSDAALARLWFEHHQPENTTILIKGSRGIRLETITDAL